MAKKWIIEWDSGYGTNYDEVEAESYEVAQKMAYESWREDVESQADYGVVGEATDELREEHGL